VSDLHLTCTLIACAWKPFKHATSTTSTCSGLWAITISTFKSQCLNFIFLTQARQQQLAQQQQGAGGSGSGTGERISSGSYAEMLQQDINNPFPIISGSLTSTSPHTGTCCIKRPLYEVTSM